MIVLEIVELGGRRYAQFERLSREQGLVHAFSTRPDDVSPRDDALRDRRAARRGRMAVDLGLEPANLCYSVQVHRDGIAVIERSEQCGPQAECDALVTSLVHVPLMTFSADCPLVLVYDPRRRALGLVHASWRCTVAGLAGRIVATMSRRFGCRPGDVLAGVGPSAGPCCYEVREDLYAAAAGLPQRDRLFVHRDGRMYFDLWRANVEQLVGAGVPAGSIERSGVCTLCRNDVFYSYRREGSGCGHFGLMAALV